MTKNNIPKIRFKGFSNNWEKYRLGEIGTSYTGLSGKSKDDFGHGSANYITYMNIFKNPIANADEVEKIEIDNAQNTVKYGDVFFTTSSETPEEVGMSSVWLGNKQNLYLNSFCFGYRFNDNTNIDYTFIAYLLRSKTTRKSLELLAQGISRYNISKNKVMDIYIDSPQKTEQEKIGKFFKNIDKLITTNEQKLEKLKNIKIALLENMFPQNNETTPKIRFKGFNDSWKEKSFADIFNYERPDKYIVKSDKYSNKYRTPVLTANKAFILGYTNETRTYNNPSIIFDDFTLESKYVDFPYMVKSSAIKILTIKNNKNDDLYFSSKLLDTAKLEMLGHARHYISIVQPTKVYIPQKIEQEKIGNFFKNIDNLISLTEKKIEKLKNIKNALLEKMFV